MVFAIEIRLLQSNQLITNNSQLLFGRTVRKCRINSTKLIEIIKISGTGDLTAALYIEQYGH